MGRDCSKASGNVYFEARKAAAEYDDRLYMRAKSSGLLSSGSSNISGHASGGIVGIGSTGSLTPYNGLSSKTLKLSHLERK